MMDLKLRKMRKILLPTDFSENAWNAIAYALALFSQEECRFYVMNAFQTGPSSLTGMMNKGRGTRLYEATKESSQIALSELEDRIYSSGKVQDHHQFEFLLLSDPILQAIGKTVIEKDIDFVFMGTQGASGLKGVFLGSNAVRVIREIDFCPIVAVPEGYEFQGLSEILFATGYEHLYEKYELQPMLQLARLWDSRIKVVHVNKEKELVPAKEKARELLGRRLKGQSYELMDLANGSKINEAIRDLTEENPNIGMVAIIDYWHSFLEKLTREPVVKKIAFKTKVPFLVMHLID